MLEVEFGEGYMMSDTGSNLVEIANLLAERIASQEGKAYFADFAGDTVLPPNIVSKAKRRASTNQVSKYYNNQKVPSDASTVHNTSAKAHRGAASPIALSRIMYEGDAIVSTAVLTMFRLAARGYSLAAYETGTMEFSSEGLRAAESVIARIDALSDYSKGFNDSLGFTRLLETMLLECCIASGVGLELSVDEMLFPATFNLFAYDSIDWISRGDGSKYPSQRSTGASTSSGIIPLNYPNIFISSVSTQLTKIISTPIMSGGMNSLFMLDEFIEDMWRILRRTGIPRTTVELDYEKVVASAPRDIKNDPEKLKAYLQSVKATVEEDLRGTAPDDAFVFYNLAKVGAVNSTGEKADFSGLLQTLIGNASSALKASPTALGLRISGGSQNTASAEMVIFTYICALLQVPVEEIISRALTLAVRLLGVEAYVKFKFDTIELRPESELEAYTAIKQNRVMELLSYGRITDDEAQYMLGLRSLPAGAEKLSGTGFYKSKEASKLPSPNTDTHGRQMASKTPASSGGKDNEVRK